MNAAESARILATVCDTLGWRRAPSLTPVKLGVRPGFFTRHEELLARIDAFGPSQGWLMETSRVAVVDGDWRRDAVEGRLLSAEFCTGTRSLHVRYANGGWLDAEYAEGDGEEYLVRDETFVSVKKILATKVTVPGGALRYRIFNGPDTTFGWRAAHSRFTGFGGQPT